MDDRDSRSAWNTGKDPYLKALASVPTVRFVRSASTSGRCIIVLVSEIYTQSTRVASTVRSPQLVVRHSEKN